MISCRELAEFLMDYLSNELEPRTRAVFEEHICACPPCEAFLKTYAETIRMGKAALCEGHDAPAVELPPALLKAILAAKGRLDSEGQC